MLAVISNLKVLLMMYCIQNVWEYIVIDQFTLGKRVAIVKGSSGLTSLRTKCKTFKCIATLVQVA